MRYASEFGIDIGIDTRNVIIQARLATELATDKIWTAQIAADLFTALTKVSAQLRPVTAESLKVSDSDKTRKAVRSYWKVAVCLAVIIVPFSVASFVASAISESIRKDISVANELAVKLRSELGTASKQAAPVQPGPNLPAKADSLPAGLNTQNVITDLQQFASTIRAIDTRSRQLALLVPSSESDPFASIRKNSAKVHETFELPDGLPDLPSAAATRTLVYQDVRYFAQSLVDAVSVYYGAITTCILPVLYALLGTCAYLLRSFEQQISTRTFIPSSANTARFLIAAIAGAVVGLFNNFNISQTASIPPLAIAFLLGYAVDVFFAFLDGLMQTFTRSVVASPGGDKVKT